MLKKIKETCVEIHSVDAISTCKLSHYFCKVLHILTVHQTCLHSLHMHHRNDQTLHTDRLNYKQIYRLHNLNFIYARNYIILFFYYDWLTFIILEINNSWKFRKFTHECNSVRRGRSNNLVCHHIFFYGANTEYRIWNAFPDHMLKLKL